MNLNLKLLMAMERQRIASSEMNRKRNFKIRVGISRKKSSQRDSTSYATKRW